MQEMSRSMAIFGCLRSGEAHMRNMQKMNSVLLPKADAVMVICIECRTGLNFAGHQMRIHTGRASLWHILEAREDRTWMLHIHTLIEFYFYEHFQTSSQNLQVFRTHTLTRNLRPPVGPEQSHDARPKPKCWCSLSASKDASVSTRPRRHSAAGANVARPLVSARSSAKKAIDMDNTSATSKVQTLVSFWPCIPGRLIMRVCFM
ncbi:hypothetical protein HBI56_028600 [Parastagonospora nodorum]|uniref:Uncharacterized protein n=1 Tax=Phaeosphaeria nodorum (strain SN15 / ATCC MYA-4574 / FGSC 10173) TaxID=321614 RepID=A0A7U2I0Q6_PHANO|nr:hypothetical protein HBH56_016220 [Parastagonospora nodorum]QRC95082.1 hypothetical protein JI435_431770 [Parastagonospora nodorum SN15]KAH3937101.1 hypothetical protein HBH54_018240 [Parastagonospora nodorum]KAH3969240.1 hypothetical protein HBH51_122780 [Parastagonospora nodorum]KAH4006649.1 hypothetical protein HBI10_018050 [Parastagonospora nodorum]